MALPKGDTDIHGQGPAKKPAAKKTTTAGAPVPSAADLLQMANAQYGQQAADIYAPQFGFLNDEAARTKAQYGASDSTLAKLYANLVQSINGDAPAITKNYTGAEAANTANTTQGIGSIGHIYDTSAAKEAALLQQLGIQAAAPDVFAQGTRDRAQQQGGLAANGAAYGNQLNDEKASSLTFNKQAATISKEMGTEARSKLQSQLAAALDQLNGQRASLESQQASKALDLQSAAQSQAYKQQQDEINNDLALKKLELQYGPDSAAATKSAAPTGPLGSLMTEAAKLYGNQNAAGNAVKAITDTLSAYGNGQPSNVNEFINAVLKRNPHATDVPELTDLASMLFANLGLRSSTPLGA